MPETCAGTDRHGVLCGIEKCPCQCHMDPRPDDPALTLAVGEIVREYFPRAEDQEVDYILWNRTGWPCFFDRGEASLREQLDTYAAARAAGGDTCSGCGAIYFFGAGWDLCLKCEREMGGAA